MVMLITSLLKMHDFSHSNVDQLVLQNLLRAELERVKGSYCVKLLHVSQAIYYFTILKSHSLALLNNLLEPFSDLKINLLFCIDYD